MGNFPSLRAALDKNDLNLVVQSMKDTNIFSNREVEGGECPIEMARVKNCSEAIIQYLQLKSDLSQNSLAHAALRDDGFTMLGLAATHGLVDLAQELIERRVDINQRDAFHVTALHRACMNRHSDIVRLLLEKRADPSLASATGTFPFEHAVSHHENSILDLLVTKKADINTVAFDGTTPLMRAVSAGSASAVAWLISKRVDTMAQRTDGTTALMLAIRNKDLGIGK